MLRDTLANKPQSRRSACESVEHGLEALGQCYAKGLRPPREMAPDHSRPGSSWIKEGTFPAQDQPAPRAIRTDPGCCRHDLISQELDESDSVRRSNIARSAGTRLSTSATICSIVARSQSAPSATPVSDMQSGGSALRRGGKFPASHCRYPQSNRTLRAPPHNVEPDFPATVSEQSRHRSNRHRRRSRRP